MTEAPDLLERAAATMRERSAERDQEKERSMARTVAAFNAQFGTNLTEYQGWMFMVHLKLARAEGGSFREDDYLDAAAYIALAGECRGNAAAESFDPKIAFKQMSPEALKELEAQLRGEKQ